MVYKKYCVVHWDLLFQILSSCNCVEKFCTEYLVHEMEQVKPMGSMAGGNSPSRSIHS